MDAEDSSATFQGDVTATTIALNDGAGDAALIFNGTSAQTVVGNVTVTGNGGGCRNLDGEQRRRSDVCGEYRCGEHADDREHGG